ERAPGQHPVEIPLAVDVLEMGALAAPEEDGLVEPDRAHRPHRRVDAARDQPPRPPEEPAVLFQSHSASAPVQYDTTRSAPARLIAASDSSAACRSSSQPRAAAAFTIAYSPDTLYAATGTSNASRTARITSRYGSAGLIMIASAPSSMSSSLSRSASRTLAGSIW